MDDAEIARRLGDDGCCICADYLAPALTVLLRDDFQRVADAQGLHRAGTGQGDGLGIRDDVRRDAVHWFDPATTHPAQVELLGKIDSLRGALNRQLYLGLWDFEGHYASFPVDGFYRRHRDAFRADDKRCVSLIVYLNRNWHTEDGGCLRMHGEGKPVDVEPLDGTMVCFLSRVLEHEVLPNHAVRRSFTGWFRTRPHVA